MKRLIALSITLVLTLTLAACTGGGGDSSGNNNSPPPSTNSSDPVSVQQQTPNEPSEPSEPQESSGGGAAGGTGGNLADAYIEMFSGGTYYVKYRSSQEYDGDKMDVVAEVAVNGDDTSMIYEMEGMSMQIIAKDNKTYSINHEEKTVMVMSVGSAQQDSTNAFGSNFVYKGAGTGELFGASLPYEEYETDSGNVRFFFDGSKLTDYEASGDGMTVQMEILEISKDIPSGMFDIPDGYEVTEY